MKMVMIEVPKEWESALKQIVRSETRREVDEKNKGAIEALLLEHPEWKGCEIDILRGDSGAIMAYAVGDPK